MEFYMVNSWFRALARFCDYCLFFLILGAATLFLPYFYGPFFYYYLALATPLLWAPVEALLITKWGTTPGKALLGLSVTNAQGFRLSFPLSLRRAFFLPGRPGTLLQKTISWKRKACAIAASAAFVLAGVYGNFLTNWSVGLTELRPPQQWVQYSSDDAGFKIAFPTDPEQESKELVIPDGKVLNYEEVTSNSRKVSYSVTHMDLPRKWRFAANTTLMKGVLDVLVKHTEGAELIEKNFDRFDGHRILDYRMKVGENEVKGRLIIVGSKLYKLAITYPPAIANEMQHNQFLESFEIT